jgi:hypothetical protein
VDIVERIRCEAKAGLGDFRKSKHDERIVRATKIAYDFQFDVNGHYETGSGRAEFRGAPLALDLSASLRNDRNAGGNKRDFLIVEDLEELSKATCPKDNTPPNWVYPIVGSIGMDELVRTYIKLEKLTDLAPGGAKTGANDVFADELTFTTEWSAGATATIELNTVAGTFRLTKIAPFGNAGRRDEHSVTVALARDPADDPDLPAPGVTKGPGERPHLVADRASLAQKKGTRAKAKSARMAIAEAEEEDDARPYVDSKRVANLILRDASPRNRVLLEVLRRRNLRDDDRVAARVLRAPP